MSKLAAAAAALSALALIVATGASATVAVSHTEAPAPLPTINSSIKDLLANPATAAVLEKHLPGVAAHPALPQFQDMTLAEVMPLSGGAVTPEIIAAIDADLQALPAS